MSFETAFRNQFYSEAVGDTTIFNLIGTKLLPIFGRPQVFPYCYYNFEVEPDDTPTSNGHLISLTLNFFVDSEQANAPHAQLLSIDSAFYDKFHNKDFNVPSYGDATYFRRLNSRYMVEPDGITLLCVSRYIVKFGA